MLAVFEKELLCALEGHDKSTIHHISQHMISSDYTEMGIKPALRSLINDNCKNTQILAALVRCEWKSLQLALPKIESLDEQQQSKEIRDLIERFNVIQHALISVTEELWQDKVITKNHSRVLLETQAALQKDKHVDIYNLFDEMPVHATIDISDWDGNIITTLATPELGRVFSADKDMSYAYINSPIEGFRIKVVIDYVTGRKVQLKVVTIDTSEVSRRQQVRVALDKKVAIKLYQDNKLVCSASITEFSLSGLGLVASEELSFVPGDELRCQAKIGKVDINHMGEVIWVQSGSENGRFGIKLSYDKVIRQKLNAEILHLQRTKIDKLTHLGMPKTLLPKR